MFNELITTWLSSQTFPTSWASNVPTLYESGSTRLQWQRQNETKNENKKKHSPPTARE